MVLFMLVKQKCFSMQHTQLVILLFYFFHENHKIRNKFYMWKLSALMDLWTTTWKNWNKTVTNSKLEDKQSTFLKISTNNKTQLNNLLNFKLSLRNFYLHYVMPSFIDERRCSSYPEVKGLCATIMNVLWCLERYFPVSVLALLTGA